MRVKLTRDIGTPYGTLRKDEVFEVVEMESEEILTIRVEAGKQVGGLKFKKDWINQLID